MEMLPASQRLAAAYHYQTIQPVTRELTEDIQVRKQVYGIPECSHM